MSTGFRKFPLLVCVTCWMLMGCEGARTLPEGVNVSGAVRYGGALSLGASRHVSVVLGASFPAIDQALNESQFIQPATRLGGGRLEYALYFVRPGSYRLWAGIFEDTELAPLTGVLREHLALGALGGACGLRMSAGKIEVGDTDLELEEFEIFDEAGFADPCYQALADMDAGPGDGGMVDPGPPLGRACEVDVPLDGDDRFGSSEDCDEPAPLCVVLPTGGACTRYCEEAPEVCEAPTSCLFSSI